jgi:hypothetical protein
MGQPASIPGISQAPATMPDFSQPAAAPGGNPWDTPAQPAAPTSATDPMAADPASLGSVPQGAPPLPGFPPAQPTADFGQPQPGGMPPATLPEQPAAPGGNPWDTPAQPAAPTSATDPASPDPMANPAASNPFLQTPPAQTATPDLNAQTPGAGGALDLSSMQSAPGAPDPAAAQPAGGSPLPEIPPQENAPTDLSHLIAGEDESHQKPGDVYNPPVAPDQNLPVNNVQTPAPAEGGAAAPPGKHLNLTKVILIAGIPIILIVAALSAYLILGIGKTAPQEPQNQTSLPIQQASPAQAPLTNPPAQIVPAPSPSIAPAQATGSSQLAPLPSASAAASPSLSPAMQAAQRASASPAATASPAPSSPSLPTLP